MRGRATRSVSDCGPRGMGAAALWKHDMRRTFDLRDHPIAMRLVATKLLTEDLALADALLGQVPPQNKWRVLDFNVRAMRHGDRLAQTHEADVAVWAHDISDHLDAHCRRCHGANDSRSDGAKYNEANWALSFLNFLSASI